MSTILDVNKNFKIYIYKKGNDMRIRTKCNCYETGEKTAKFFLNL